MSNPPAIQITTNAVRVRKFAADAGKPFLARHDELIAKAHPDGLSELAFTHAGRTITILAHRYAPYGGKGERPVLRVLAVDAEPSNERILADTLATARRAIEKRDPREADALVQSIGADGWSQE